VFDVVIVDFRQSRSVIGTRGSDPYHSLNIPFFTFSSIIPLFRPFRKSREKGFHPLPGNITNRRAIHESPASAGMCIKTRGV
ncbi:MAG: hypothetical protein MJ141_07285, partial [Clostridia bacterium]|nr:hypothetical protein [Clostridia bacterium]